MRAIALASLFVAQLSSTALAWNDKGHVVAELAYERLTPAQRQQVAAIQRQHPHCQEFLFAHTPAAAQ